MRYHIEARDRACPFLDSRPVVHEGHVDPLRSGEHDTPTSVIITFECSCGATWCATATATPPPPPDVIAMGWTFTDGPTDGDLGPLRFRAERVDLAGFTGLEASVPCAHHVNDCVDLWFHDDSEESPAYVHACDLPALIAALQELQTRRNR